MKENTLIKILGVCIAISIGCNIGTAFVLNERLKELEWQSEMEEMASWPDEIKQQSYDRAFSEWGDFDCTFDNESLTLETECGGHGYICITIFSYPKVNISLGHFDKYKTIEKWELDDDNNILIKDIEENMIIIQKELVFKKEYPTRFLKSIANASSWYFYAPYGTKTVGTINILDNTSSNLTIVVRKEISPFSYMDVSCNFEPVIYVFEAET